MPRRARFSFDDVRQVADAQLGLITASQLVQLGVPPSTSNRRLGNVWTRVLPGVHLLSNAAPTPAQRIRAALLYCGDGSLLTGATVLEHHGLSFNQPPLGDRLHLLIPHPRQRQPAEFVVPERCTRLPAPTGDEHQPMTSVARAAIDVVRRMGRDWEVRATLAAVLQRRLTTVDELEREVREAPRQGTGFARAAMEELRAGTRSLPEAEFRDAVLAAGMDEPHWNPVLTTLEGRFIAQPDGYWDEGVAFEVDSREHHFEVDDWEATMARHSNVTAHGILVIHGSPRQIRVDIRRILDRIDKAREVARSRPRPAVVIRPSI